MASIGLGAARTCSGATAFLLIQGEFDTNSAGLETSRWQVNDPDALLLHGQALLDAVFGAPQLVTGTTTYTTNTTSFIGDNTTWKVNYTFYDGLGFFVNSFKRNNLTLTANSGTGQAWNYYVAGGTYQDGYPPPNYDYSASGSYDNGLWTSSYSGQSNRLLADTNGSPYDAWVFGNDGYTASPQAQVIGFSPTVTSFSGLTVNVVNILPAPEPSRTILILAGLVGCQLKRRRINLSSEGI